MYITKLITMNKNLITLAVLAMMSSCVYAQQITEQQAKERALQFLTDGGKAKSRSAAPTGKLLKKASVEVSNLYAYNIDGGGFVIVSGDERTIPVLGYSDNGQIDWQHMPDNMRAWLTNYSQAIHALGNAELGLGAQPTTTGRVAIEPLLKTQWNQYEPYWNKCPFKEDMGRMCLTGCVATAMAQVMNYHQWPKKACKAVPAYDVGFAPNIDHYDELPATTFDWDNMIPSYHRLRLPEPVKQALVVFLKPPADDDHAVFLGGEGRAEGTRKGTLRGQSGLAPEVIYDTALQEVVMIGVGIGGRAFVGGEVIEDGLSTGTAHVICPRHAIFLARIK
jgi:hypothetical protein